MTPIEQAAQALRLIAAQDQGCGGNVTEAEAWRNAQSIARAALASLEAAKQEPLTDAQRGPKCWLNRGKCIEPNYCKHPTHCAKNDTRA